MKKIFIVFISGFILSASAFSGELVNKSTNETLVFTPEYNSQKLHIDSTDESLSSRTVSLSSLSKEKSQMRLYGLSGAFCDSLGGINDSCVVFLFLPPLLPAIAAVDTLLLPISLPIKIIQNSKFRKDYQTLQQVIASVGLIEVSDARFNRVVQILKKARRL